MNILLSISVSCWARLEDVYRLAPPVSQETEIEKYIYLKILDNIERVIRTYWIDSTLDKPNFGLSGELLNEKATPLR